MASPCVQRNVFSILLLLVLSSITPLSSSLSPTDKVTKYVVRQLCSEPTVETHFCIAWLISDPTTFTLDLNGLLSLVLLKTQLLAYKNLGTMKGLSDGSTTDPALKITYEYCITEYEFAIKSIEEAMGFVSSKAYQVASQAAFSAFGSIRSCDVHLERRNVPAYVPQRNLMFERMCKIDTVFSNLLTS